MRGYLLDTHVLLWWLADPGQLRAEARAAIADGGHAVYFSAAGAWEMAIKRSIGRLSYPENLGAALEEAQIEVLPIGLGHALGIAALPRHHQDPFDRMMVVQAKMEDLVLVTRDEVMGMYGVEVLRG